MDDAKRSKLLAKAAVQHRGGTSGEKGYRYQDRVVVYELLCGGYAALREKSQWSALYEQEAKDSFTDDLHVRLHSRRHVQIKSKDGLSWEAALRTQFKSERDMYPDAVLELCVHDPAVQKSLEANKTNWDLDDVKVTCVPYDMMRQAYKHQPIRNMMKKFLREPLIENSYLQFWHHLLGVWVDELETSAVLFEFFERCALTYDGRMIAPSGANTDVSTAVKRWNEDQQALIFSADELSLVVKLVGTTFDDLVVAIDRLPAEIWSREVIRSPWEVTNALQQFDPH